MGLAGAVSEIVNGVTEYYEIADIKVIPRRDIFDQSQTGMFKDSDESYFVFSLKNRKTLTKKIEPAVGGNRVFRYAKFSELRNSLTINDFNKTAQEALGQIEANRYADKYQLMGKVITGIGVNFNADLRRIDDWLLIDL